MLVSIWNLLEKYWPLFLQGAWGTLWISFIVVLTGTILGGLLALGRLLKFKPLTWLIDIYVEIIRGTPILLQLYFFTYGISSLVPFRTNEAIWVVTALIINSSAYVSEVFRAGIQSVDKGQFEAAQSLGLSEKNMMVKIILPQAIKNILPALGNEFIMMIKETSLASIFFIPSLMTSEQIVSSVSYKKIETLSIVGIIYLVMTKVLNTIVARFERKGNR